MVQAKTGGLFNRLLLASILVFGGRMSSIKGYSEVGSADEGNKLGDPQ